MRTYNMDLQWKFISDDDLNEGGVVGHRAVYSSVKAGAVAGPASKNYNDVAWQEITLPHDFVVKTEIKEEYPEKDHHAKPSAWYRKSFLLDKECEGKQIAICFEGIARQAEIYLNGSLIARSFSCYTEQFIDITERAYCGGKVNTLAVHVHSAPELAECWSYEGGGIYRHVKLYCKDRATHIAHNGVFVCPKLVDEKKNLWLAAVNVEVENSSYGDSACLVKVEMIKNGKTVVATESEEYAVSALTNKIIPVSFNVENPELWDVDNPSLYNFKVSVISAGKTADEETVVSGFRYYRFDPNEGFFLNGRYVKIKGVSCHQDHGGVGAAIPDDLQFERIKALKKMGANMYRSGHNNPAREVIDACDRLGLLVIDENRHFEASEENLRHLDIVTKRDRNHPSVFMYCLLNEEFLQNTEEGRNIYRRMKEEVLKHDKSRLFTGAMHGNFFGAGEEMEVCGINYAYGYLDNLHKSFPNTCVIATESNSHVSTRGCYKTDREGAHVITSYDDECVPWGNTVRRNWKFVRERKYLSGCTVWTGMDYHGETVMPWPTVEASYGLMDMCGFKKGLYYFSEACYSLKPMIKIVPHWNWKAGDTVKVAIASNCQQTELIVNGVSRGIKDHDCCDANEEFIPFEAGYIQANGYIDGKLVVSDIEYTAGEPKNCVYEVNKTTFSDDGNDVIIMNCAVTDKDGHENPLADNLMRFDVEGDAEIIGVGNGDPNSHESECAPVRKLYFGKCQVIIRIGRNAKAVKVTVSSDGLKSAEFVTEKINHVEDDGFIYSAVNNFITHLEATASSEEWIDPLIRVDDDDMNTFLPVEIEPDNYQKDYKHGWKLYRVIVTLPKTHKDAVERKFTLRFDDVRINKMFVFAGGNQIHKTDITHRYVTGSINCEFNGKEGEEIELRVLVNINIESPEDGAGFKKSIVLI